MKVAIIIARGGSKRIPRKNVKSFHGQPIMLYPLQAALRSNLFDEVYVSTEDEEIAQIAMAHGACVPFMRPKHLATDKATTLQVMGHAVNYLLDHAAPLQAACCLYPCSPFVTPVDLVDGWRALADNGRHSYSLPVAQFPVAAQRALTLEPDRTVRMHHPEMEKERTQDVDLSWYDAGQWYWGRATAWKVEMPIYQGAAIGVPVHRNKAIDINVEADWEFAELVFGRAITEGIERAL